MKQNSNHFVKTKKRKKSYNKLLDAILREGKIMLKKIKNLVGRKRCYCGKEINYEQLEKIIEKKGIIIDVRSVQEYEEGHIPNAISLPVYEIKENANNVLPDKTQKIIVYCSTGYRSKKAQKILEGLGYEKVYNLCNGFIDY